MCRTIRGALSIILHAARACDQIDRFRPRRTIGVVPSALPTCPLFWSSRHPKAILFAFFSCLAGSPLACCWAATPASPDHLLQGAKRAHCSAGAPATIARVRIGFKVACFRAVVAAAAHDS